MNVDSQVLLAGIGGDVIEPAHHSCKDPRLTMQAARDGRRVKMLCGRMLVPRAWAAKAVRAGLLDECRRCVELLEARRAS